MSETESQSNPSPNPNPAHNLGFSIWPPTQRTRDAVTLRLIETLTTESVLSKRYGTVPKEEAADLAKKIEEEAFATAGDGGVKANTEDDGIETLQVYSKEISKRMLDAVKSRSDSSAPVKEESSDVETATVTTANAADVAEDKKDEVAEAAVEE